MLCSQRQLPFNFRLSLRFTYLRFQGQSHSIESDFFPPFPLSINPSFHSSRHLVTLLVHIICLPALSPASLGSRRKTVHIEFSTFWDHWPVLRVGWAFRGKVLWQRWPSQQRDWHLSRTCHLLYTLAEALDCSSQVLALAITQKPLGHLSLWKSEHGLMEFIFSLILFWEFGLKPFQTSCTIFMLLCPVMAAR